MHLDRKLQRALIGSLAAHLFLFSLWMAPGERLPAGAAASRPLAAQLAATGGDIARPLPPKQVISPPRPLSHSPLVAPVAAQTAPVQTAAPSAIVAEVAEAPKERGASGAQPQAEAAVPEARVSSDGLREYRIALTREARRYKEEYDRKYAEAERGGGGREGRVELTLRAGGGALPALQLARSSGHVLLDQQALELVGRAVRMTALPVSLRNQGFTMALVMDFRLNDE